KGYSLHNSNVSGNMKTEQSDTVRRNACTIVINFSQCLSTAHHILEVQRRADQNRRWALVLNRNSIRVIITSYRICIVVLTGFADRTVLKTVISVQIDSRGGRRTVWGRQVVNIRSRIVRPDMDGIVNGRRRIRRNTYCNVKAESIARLHI